MADTLVAGLWAPKFPSPADVQAAAASFRELPHWDGGEGPRCRITIGPGVIMLSRNDLARHGRTREREHERHLKDVEQAAAIIVEKGRPPRDPLPTRIIDHWSAESRANMTKTLSMLDYSPLVALCATGRIPAMVSLTYPGDWLTVAPDPQTTIKQLTAFRKRYARAWGEDLIGTWKREFQDRHAVHFHMYMVPPWGLAGAWRKALNIRMRPAVGDGLPFRQWLSVVWADVVNHPDAQQHVLHERSGTNVSYGDGLRCSDPVRLAVYFSKHGSFRDKDYQNEPPPEWAGKSVGRYWGYWGLRKLTSSAELYPEDYLQVARTLRRYARAKHVLRVRWVPRPGPGQISQVRVRSAYPDVIGLAGAQLIGRGPPKRRKVRRRAGYLSQGAGFVCLNNAPLVAIMVASMTSERNSRAQAQAQGSRGQGAAPAVR
jgi:hypothetical protein